MRRFAVAALAMASLVAASAGLAGAQGGTSATLTVSGGTVAAGIGLHWGTGTHSYSGKTYPVKVEGLSVGEVGVIRATAWGEGSNREGPGWTTRERSGSARTSRSIARTMVCFACDCRDAGRSMPDHPSLPMSSNTR